MVLLLIGGLPLTMILAATWLWVYVAKGDIDLVNVLGTANRGTLLSPPLPLQELELRDHKQVLFRFRQDSEAKWRLLLPAQSLCKKDCEQLIHYLGQIHIAMGKYTNRIERIYLGTEHKQMVALQAQLGEKHPQLKFLYTRGANFTSLLESSGLATNAPVYYLVDPQGWVMMSYSQDANGKDVMADLNFLLKNSNG